MKIKTIMLGGAAFAMSATAALAEDMTIVSWGGCLHGFSTSCIP